MPSPEQIAHQSFELYAPVDKAGGGFGGSVEPDNSQSIVPAGPSGEGEKLIPFSPESSDHSTYFYADLKPSVGSQERKEPETSIQKSRSSLEQLNPEPSDSNKGPENFIWTEDLSSNGQQLWLYLLGEGGVMEFLHWIASQEGWNLEAAIQELEANNVLDRSYPGRIRIISKYRGYD